MNANQLTEPHYSIAEVARLCGGIDPCTVWRWQTKGVGPRKVKLRAVKVGGRLRILKRDLDAFLAALNAPSDTPPSLPSGPSPQQRRAAKKAARELEKVGV